ncbi:MAG TPA: family 20 glycosylhydrolase [Acidimicrobiales bacterium]|nr:family 20 glycosylhydrolase [Acidimicrobiales bacterium]
MSRVEDLVLVPRPRHLEALGGTVADPVPVGAPPTEVGPAGHLADAGGTVHTATTAGLPAQGFRLTISAATGIRIEHGDDAGLRYATQLLGQVRGQSPDGRLPALHVEDHPDIPTRGLMLDVSRDRVPTRATLARLVEIAALARLNQLQLYIEHTFTYPGHDEVWAGASPLTPDDVAWLDDLCAAQGIELVANQNCFGHMGRWLAHDRYRDRAECPDGWEPIPGLRLPPSVLAPTAENAAFTLGLLGELLPAFRSRAVHIGGDEPFELGRGASRAAVEARGLGPVYVEHLRRLADPLLAEGRQVQVWADVLRRHPQQARDLPEGIVPVAWCYEAPPPGGRPLDLPEPVVQLMAAFGTGPEAFSGFAPQVAPLAKAGVPFWVAPGTSSWCSLVGRIDNARANLLDAALVGRAHDTEGYLVTDWGDGGHHQPPAAASDRWSWAGRWPGEPTPTTTWTWAPSCPTTSSATPPAGWPPPSTPWAGSGPAPANGPSTAAPSPPPSSRAWSTWCSAPPTGTGSGTCSAPSRTPWPRWPAPGRPAPTRATWWPRSARPPAWPATGPGACSAPRGPAPTTCETTWPS